MEINNRDQQILSLQNTNEFHERKIAFATERLKLNLDKVSVSLRETENKTLVLRKEKLQLQYELSITRLQNHNLLSTIDGYKREFQNFENKFEKLEYQLSHAREIILDNHNYALQMEIEYDKCNHCKKRYTPKRPYLFDDSV